MKWLVLIAVLMAVLVTYTALMVAGKCTKLEEEQRDEQEMDD